MTTLRQIAQVANQGSACLRSLANANKIQPCLRNVIQHLTVKTFSALVTTPSPEALGGSVSLTIRGDGSYDLTVHMHDSGLPDYSFRLAILLRSTDGKIFALYSSGTVHGTLSTGSRDFDDHQTAQEKLLHDEWSSFALGTFEVHKDYQDNLTSFISDAFSDVLGFVATVATIGGPAALVIWGGKALGAATGFEFPADLGWPGLMVAEGQFILAGPTFFIPMFVLGVAAGAALFKTRKLHTEEITEADKVFLGTVPYEAVTVCNASGPNGNCFAAPGPTGNYLIGANQWFDSLVADDTSKHTLIHELTHVWQMEHTPFKSFISCDAIITSIDVQTQDSTKVYFDYYFYVPGKPWDSYNTEQQAQIVADWWVATQYGEKSQDVSYTIAFGTQNEDYIDSVIRAVKP
jgi:hypothetical protein